MKKFLSLIHVLFSNSSLSAKSHSDGNEQQSPWAERMIFCKKERRDSSFHRELPKKKKKAQSPAIVTGKRIGYQPLFRIMHRERGGGCPSAHTSVPADLPVTLFAGCQKKPEMKNVRTQHIYFFLLLRLRLL